MVRAQGRNRDLLNITDGTINEANNITKRLPTRIAPVTVHPFSYTKSACADNGDGNCIKCLSDPSCGYCVDTGLCLEGTEAGPIFGECGRVMDKHAKPNWLHPSAGIAAAPYPTYRGIGPPIPKAGGDKKAALRVATLVCEGGNDAKEEDVPHFIASIDERVNFTQPLHQQAERLHVAWTADLHGLDCQRRLLEWISRRDDQGKPWSYAEKKDADALTAEWFKIRYEDGDELPLECRDAAVISEVVRKHEAAIRPADISHTILRGQAKFLVMRMPADTEVTRVDGRGHPEDDEDKDRGAAGDIMKPMSPFSAPVSSGTLPQMSWMEPGAIVKFKVPARFLLSQINLQQSIFMMMLQRSVGNRPKGWILPR